MATVLSAVAHASAAGKVADSPFPAARGVLERFADENVADKFTFERMEAAGPQAEVSARNGKILVRATDENRAAAAVGRYIREVAKGHWSRCGNRVPASWPLPNSSTNVICGSDWRAVVSDNAGKRCTFVDAGLRGNASTDIR